MDVAKLKAYLSSPYPVDLIMPPPPEGLDEDEREEIAEELKDDMSEASQLRRKLDYVVGYMETSDPAGAFACGTCKYLVGGVSCVNVCVQATVDAANGCCNLWQLSKSSGITMVFPPPDEPDEDDEGDDADAASDDDEDAE